MNPMHVMQEVAAAQERAEEAMQRAAQAEAASAAAAGQVQSARQALMRAEQQRDTAQQTAQVSHPLLPLCCLFFQRHICQMSRVHLNLREAGGVFQRVGVNEKKSIKKSKRSYPVHNKPVIGDKFPSSAG